MANEKKVTLTIDGIDANNKKSSTKIPYVNPNASDDVMRTFANKCAALSTDTHTATTKTTDEDITNAATPKPKVALPDFNTYANLTNIKEAEGSYNAALSSGDHFPNFTYYVDMPSDWTDIQATFTVYNQKSSAALLKMLAYVKPDMPGTVTGEATITIHFDETETTAATTAVITVPVTGNASLTIL